MHVNRYYPRSMLGGVAAMLMLACDNSTPSTTEPNPLPSGAIDITVATTGPQRDLDSDGYTLTVDMRASGELEGSVFDQRIDANAKLIVGSLRSGKYRLLLADLQANCSVDGGPTRQVDVVRDAAVSPVSFSVTCADRGPACAGCWDY